MGKSNGVQEQHGGRKMRGRAASGLPVWAPNFFLAEIIALDPNFHPPW